MRYMGNPFNCQTLAIADRPDKVKIVVGSRPTGQKRSCPSSSVAGPDDGVLPQIASSSVSVALPALKLPRVMKATPKADRKQNLKSFDGSKTVVACGNVDVDGTCSSPFNDQSMKHEDLHDEVFDHEASHGDVSDHDVEVSDGGDDDASGAGEDSPECSQR